MPALDAARWRRVQAVFEHLAAERPADPGRVLREWFPNPADIELRALVAAMLAADAVTERGALPATSAALLRAALAESGSGTDTHIKLRRRVSVDKPA